MMYHSSKLEIVMIKNFDKQSYWNVKYISYFRIIRSIGPRQLEVFDPADRLQKANISDVHKILPSDFIISSVPDEQVFHRKGKYITDPCILKAV